MRRSTALLLAFALGITLAPADAAPSAKLFVKPSVLELSLSRGSVGDVKLAFTAPGTIVPVQVGCRTQGVAWVSHIKIFKQKNGERLLAAVTALRAGSCVQSFVAGSQRASLLVVVKP